VAVKTSRGTVLFPVLIILSFLSVLLLLTTNYVLLGKKALAYFEDSMKLFYMTEAGIAHGQAFCKAQKINLDFLSDPSKKVDTPFDTWHSFGKGKYLIKVFPLGPEWPSTPFIYRESGLLLMVTACLATGGQKKMILLMDGPPAWNRIAWWELG